MPNGEHTFYLKQHLHEGEDIVCIPGHENSLINVKRHPHRPRSLRRLYHLSHSTTAAAQQADVYLASALISPGGYAKDAELLAAIAKRHQLPVLLANHVSTTGGWQTCGWNAAGELTVKANGTQEYGTETLQDLSLAVVENADMFTQFQQLTGRRQRLVKQIHAMETREQIATITW